MQCLKLSFSLQVLWILLKLPPDIDNKSLEVLKIFPEASYKVGLCDWNGALMVTFVLDFSDANVAIEEIFCKKGIVYPNSPSKLEIILILLTKMITIYVGISKIGV